MFWVLVVLSILLLFFILILFTKLTILINYYHHNDNDDLKIKFKIWFGLIKYTINVPLIKVDDNSPSIVVESKSKMGESSTESTSTDSNQITAEDVENNFSNAKKILNHVFGLHRIIRKFFRKVTMKGLEWNTLIGLGDAAHTGTITGAIWAFKGSIIGLISHYLKLKEMPKITVTPHFQAAVIQTRLTCIIQFRIGYAILAGLKLFRFWRGGLPHFKKKTNFANDKTKSI
ncbi:DUF2953 domain-containing protein [Bacillus sp. UNC41MFS5]|uniref:DUF2953 domain-containing protein n=1 Tax=Bacillus sp. UNC41MFS5 TaxID=1449046 RepID=UPI00047CDCE2|nr:DUF2953 domain-containing protein [Bacillus sp. UNC41MFS5]